MQRNLKILVIVGAARSGSTIASQHLSIKYKLAYAGELNHLWDRGLEKNHLCGCGSNFHDCQKWHDILKRSGIANTNGIKFYNELLQCLAKNYSINPIKRLRRKVDTDNIKFKIRNLYHSIASEYQTEFILDGAKQPIYARLLIDIFGRENVHVIHLVRNPHGVVASATSTKMKTDSGNTYETMLKRTLLSACIDWTKTNISSDLLRNKSASYHLIRYEDVCKNQGADLDEIAVKIGLSSAPNEESAISKARFIHTISGNPVRLSKKIILRNEDRRWQKEISPISSAIIKVLTSLRLFKYGYHQTNPEK